MSTLAHVDPWHRWSVTGVGVLLCGCIVGIVALARLDWTTVGILQMGIPIVLGLAIGTYGW